MSHLPLVTSADYKGGYMIRLTFNDGTQKTVDFRRWLEGPIFEPLLEPGYFKTFRVEGGTVVWPNGADIAPETLRDAEEATEAA